MTVQQRMKDAHGDSDGVGDLAIQFGVHIRMLHVPRRFHRPLRGSNGYHQRGGNQRGSCLTSMVH